MAPWAFGSLGEAQKSWAKLVDLLQHIWPVVFIAGLGGVARNMRVMRGNLLDELNAQYVTTARSKGLTDGQVMRRHAVPNALHPIIMYQGTVLPYMLQGELQASIVLGAADNRHAAADLAAQRGHLHRRQLSADLRRAAGGRESDR